MNDRLADVHSIEERSDERRDSASEMQEKLAPPKKPNKQWKPLFNRKSESQEEESEKKTTQEKSQDCGDVELGTLHETSCTSDQQHMKIFFSDVEIIKKNIDSIREASNRIGEISEEAINASKAEKENNLSTSLEATVSKANTMAKRTKKILTHLKEETTTLKHEVKLSQSNIRVRENLVNTLTRKFVEEVKLYQKTQQMYQVDMKSKAARQIQAIMPDVTDADINAVIHSDGGRDALYKESILAGSVADPINTAYKSVSSKYKDIMTLERSIGELRQIFVEVALLVEGQGDLLDHIEMHVQKASEAVDDGNVDLVRSMEYQRKIRKKQCWIIVIVLVIAAVVFAILFN